MKSIMMFIEQYMQKAHGLPAGSFKIGKLVIKFDRWPWQGWGWFPHKNGCKKGFAPLNPRGSRFGGGWNYKLGLQIGGSTVIIDLLFGSIRIHKEQQ